MAFPDRVVVATRNRGKLREILRICAEWPVEWVTFDDVEWPAIEETEDTYLGNATIKARGVADATGITALGDDSGIEVDALGGRPGVRSARFAGPDPTDEQNLTELLRAIAGVPSGGRTARYRAVVVLATTGGELVHAEGICEGRLLKKPRGTGGFGYDPIFVPEGWDRTMAELEPDEKDRISHRGRSLRALGQRLRD